MDLDHFVTRLRGEADPPQPGFRHEA